MKTHTMEEAKKKKLIQLTIWVNGDLKDWIESEYKRLTALNKNREVMIVEFRNRWSIYANDLTGNR